MNLGSNPVESPEFLRFMRQLLKLSSKCDHLLLAKLVVSHLLLAKLKAYGLDKDSCALFRHYLSNRQQRVKIGDTFSSWEGVKRGVP